MIDYVGEVKRIANFGWDWRLPMWVKYTILAFFLLVLLIRLQTTIRNGFLCTVAQKTSFSARMCVLSIRIVKIECMVVKIPKIWPSREIPAKTKTFESTLSLCYWAKYTNVCIEALIGNRIWSFWINGLFSPKTPSGEEILHFYSKSSFFLVLSPKTVIVHVCQSDITFTFTFAMAS